MQLADNTKYIVATAMREIAQRRLMNVLEQKNIPIMEMEIREISRLEFGIRLKPTGGGAPRHITVKVSEPW
jgi:hypothetical protein